MVTTLYLSIILAGQILSVYGKWRPLYCVNCGKSRGPQMMHQSAEWALKELEPLWTPAPFLEALKHEDKDVRLYAVKALEKVGDKSAVPALAALREDEDRKVKKEAEKAIKRLQK